MKKIILCAVALLTAVSPLVAQKASSEEKTQVLRSAISDLSRAALTENPSLHVAPEVSENRLGSEVTDKIVEHLHRGLAAEEMTDEEFSVLLDDIDTLGSALWVGTQSAGTELPFKLGPTESDPPSCTKRCRTELIDCISVLAGDDNSWLTPFCVASWEVCLLDCVNPF